MNQYFNVFYKPDQMSNVKNSTNKRENFCKADLILPKKPYSDEKINYQYAQ